jgi:sialate O-acetylesterase
MRLRYFAIALLALPGFAQAGVTLPAVLSEHMVLQRGLPVHIWGKAAPGESVAVTFRAATVTGQAGPIGKWSIFLPAGEAGGPFDLTIKGENTIAFNDILVGDVWVASGQSNMEWQLRRTDGAEAEIATANFPKIRRVKIARKVADFPQDDATVDAWSALTPQTAGAASAVAYFFAKNLQSSLKDVPLGIIESFWGGTAVEAWMSLRAIGDDPGLMPIFANWARTVENYPNQLAAWDRRVATWNEQVTKARTEGKPEPPKPPVPAGPGGLNTPTGLFNGMIAPIVPYPIKGAIWYQGESNANADRFQVYSRAFTAMIRDWRRAWGVGDFPFLWVQLPNYKTNGYWPDLREQQRQSLSLTNTGMVVSIDVGNPTNLHPTNKVEIGTRMSILARGMVYGEKIAWSGPMFRSAAREGADMRVWFDHTDGGLTAKGGPLQGFEVAGPDRKFVPAESRIDGTSVVVRSAGVPDPVYVRYAWADAPECNLYNAAGLPASPFRSGNN